MSAPTAADLAAVLTVSGDPTDEELAAVVAVLAARLATPVPVAEVVRLHPRRRLGPAAYRAPQSWSVAAA